ncbi:hypothetical protein FJU08_02980 [Martelella alba]|uniref:Uncharacterized protein n=1 Tax=Martelella alba TaxID=2590451 RepID=A0A506UJM5_9HYPH|nr:hypothetical protein [Martelella alba]TPW33534.1 hypothetical protein FJU08_02980 [Martelella alba]
MSRYQCADCNMQQDTGTVCRQCGSYNMKALERHNIADSDTPPAAANSSLQQNLPIWLSLAAIVSFTTYMLVFHM